MQNVRLLLGVGILLSGYLYGQQPATTSVTSLPATSASTASITPPTTPAQPVSMVPRVPMPPSTAQPATSASPAAATTSTVSASTAAQGASTTTKPAQMAPVQMSSPRIAMAGQSASQAQIPAQEKDSEQPENSSSSDQNQDTDQQSSSSSESADQASATKDASESSAQGSAASDTNKAPVIQPAAVYGEDPQAPKPESHSKEHSKGGHEKSDTKQHGKHEEKGKEKKKEEQAGSGEKEKDGQGKEHHKKEKSSEAQAEKSESEPAKHKAKHHKAKESFTPLEQEVPEIPEEKVQIMGIDTVDISEPKGNWLYKRIWWEKAERLYEKIKNMTDQIYEARMIFFSRRTELDRNVLDPFYLSVGLNQGELTQILSYYTLFIDKERAANKELESKERQFFDMLVLEKKNLESLNGSVQNVLKLDQAIDTSLMKLMEQINLSRNYERQSWNNFKDINRELSDKKAREDYYKMDTSWKNVNNINSYIASQFTQYFDELVNKIVQETETIKSQVKALREKGIDITEQGQQLATQGALKFSSERSEEEAKEVQEEERSFWITLAEYIKAPFSYLYGLVADSISWFGSLFGFGHEEAEKTEPSAAQKNEKPVAPVAKEKEKPAAKKAEKAAQSAPPVQTPSAPDEPPALPEPTEANEEPQEISNSSMPQDQVSPS